MTFKQIIYRGLLGAIVYWINKYCWYKSLNCADKWLVHNGYLLDYKHYS